MNLNTGKFWDKKIKEERLLLENDPMTRDRIKTAYGFFPKRRKLKILDIGAGYGFIEELLAKNKDLKIYGNDISPEAIKNLKKKFKGNFKEESIYNMHYESNFFDVIFALEVLEHIPASKINSVLRKVRKVIKKSGHFIISVPVNEGLDLKKENPNAHMRIYSEKIIRKELESQDFRVLKVKKLSAFKNMYVIKKYLNKLINRWESNNLVILASTK